MQISLARQVVSFIGAMMILVGYAGAQFSWMNPRKTTYNILNGVGSAILAYVALRPFQIGFVLLEVTWAVISFYALTRASQSEA